MVPEAVCERVWLRTVNVECCNSCNTRKKVVSVYNASGFSVLLPFSCPFALFLRCNSPIPSAKTNIVKKAFRKAGRERGRDTCFHSSPVYFLVVLPVPPPSTCLQTKTQDAESTKNKTGTFPPPFQRQSGSAPRHTIRTRNHAMPFSRNSWVARYGSKTKTSDVLIDGNVR